MYQTHSPVTACKDPASAPPDMVESATVGTATAILLLRAFTFSIMALTAPPAPPPDPGAMGAAAAAANKRDLRTFCDDLPKRGEVKVPFDDLLLLVGRIVLR